jgi:hypothetical protein
MICDDMLYEILSFNELSELIYMTELNTTAYKLVHYILGKSDVHYHGDKQFPNKYRKYITHITRIYRMYNYTHMPHDVKFYHHGDTIYGYNIDNEFKHFKSINKLVINKTYSIFALVGLLEFVNVGEIIIELYNTPQEPSSYLKNIIEKHNIRIMRQERVPYYADFDGDDMSIFNPQIITTQMKHK